MNTTSKKPFDDDVEIFRWGPVPMRIFNSFDFVSPIFLQFPKIYKGDSWPRALFLSRGKSMIFMNELAAVRTAGTSVFLRYMLPPEKRRHAYNQWLSDLKAVQVLEKRLESIDLPALTLQDFIHEWEVFHNAIEQFWIHVIIPELANYGAVELLDQKLKSLIEDEMERAVVMEVLTAPEVPSFFQEEEVALSLTNNIGEHQRNFFWLKNSYNNVETLPVEFFEKRKKELPTDMAEQHLKKRNDTRMRKAEVAAKYQLTQDVIHISQAIVAGIEWQDTRKKDIWMYLHYKHVLLEEASMRLRISKDDLLNFGAGEIATMLKGGIDKSQIVKRHTAFGFLLDVGSIVPLDSEATLRYWRDYAEENSSTTTTECKGVVVSRGSGGVLQGRVRVLLDPYHASPLQEGDVLVAPMTSPEYIFAMKKSCAIVTDVGGLMSHAAIVSRELGLPCIVGTKIATKIFKDGDVIEVNADTGVVTRI